jgi:cell wall-associated NlpC family hydrolase
MRQKIIAAARSYLGCRYHHQGRTRAGIDCAGLLVCVARDVGISTESDQMGYSRTPDGMSLKRALDDFGVRVDTFQPGDFLLMRFDAQPQHIAIVTDVGIIHSYLSARRVVEHRLSDDWRARIVQAYAFPGVE